MLQRSASSVVKLLRTPGAPWKEGARTAFKRYQYIAVPVVLWSLISIFGLLSENLIGSTRLIISALLFILAIPTSIIIRLDTISIRLAMDGSELGVVYLALVIVGVNFLVIGATVGWLRSLRSAAPKIEKKEKRDSQR